MKDEAVKVTNEIVEAAVETGNEKVILVLGGVAIGVVGTLGVIKVAKTIKAKKAAKIELVTEEVEIEE